MDDTTRAIDLHLDLDGAVELAELERALLKARATELTDVHRRTVRFSAGYGDATTRDVLEDEGRRARIRHDALTKLIDELRAPPAESVAARATVVDCLVIGGGPAGLSAAIQLGRLRRSCLVVDDDAGRSLWSQVTRNHLGFPDGVTAADLRLLGQRQAVNHEAELRRGEVIGLQRGRGRSGGFVATIAGGRRTGPGRPDAGARREPGPGTARRRAHGRAPDPANDADPGQDGPAGAGRHRRVPRLRGSRRMRGGEPVLVHRLRRIRIDRPARGRRRR